MKYNGNHGEQPPPLGTEEQGLMGADRRALVGLKRWGCSPTSANTPKLTEQVDSGSAGRKLETGNNCHCLHVCVLSGHKQGGLKQQGCILSQHWRPEPEIKTWAGLCSSEEGEGESAHTDHVRGFLSLFCR